MNVTALKLPEAGIGVRWTIGDVNSQGFEALRLSIHGLWKIFGNAARYCVCVNSIPVEAAREQTAHVPAPVIWHDAPKHLPSVLKPHLDAAMAEGAAWKFLPLRVFPELHELALDNDCILWELPQTISDWFGDQERCLMGADMIPCFGRFAPFCGSQPLNAGIRGFPPGFDFEGALGAVLETSPGMLASETDEQGLQAAALSQPGPLMVVSTADVSICSAFPMHSRHLGRCGAHFVGLNMKHGPWTLDGAPCTEAIRRNWLSHRPEVYRRVGLSCAGTGELEAAAGLQDFGESGLRRTHSSSFISFNSPRGLV